MAPTTGDPGGAFVFEAGSARGRSDLANADIGSATALTATGVPSGAYFVRVRARSASGTSAPSDEVFFAVTGADCTTPNSPVSLNAVVSGTSVTLTWQAPNGPCPAMSYLIEAGSAPGMSNLASFSTGTTATSFSTTGVSAGNYYVRVRSVNAAGASGPSSEVQFTIGGPCANVPGAPTAFTSSVSGTTVVLSWVAPPGSVTSYVLEAGSTTGASNLVVTDTGNAATSLTATAGAGTYYVRVRARSACGTSAPSNEITVIVGGTTTSTTEKVFIIAADLGGNRLTFMTDMNGADWQTGPAGSTVPSVPQGNGTLNAPWHIAVDSRQRIYVADRDNNRIVRMDDLAGHGFKTFSGVGANQLALPGCEGGAIPPPGCVASVTVDSAGRIYIVASSRIVRIDDMDGTGWTTLGGPGSSPTGPGSFAGPKVVIIDAQGRILVSDSAGGRIVRLNDMEGNGRVNFGSPGSGVGQFLKPEGVAFGSLGDVDHAHPIGTAVGKFDEPHDVAVGPSGKIYILDTLNARIVRIDDMTGAGWTTFGTRTNQQTGCTGPQDPLCKPPGLFEFVAAKGLRVVAR